MEISGTTAIITGASGGIGLAAARCFAAAGARVVMAARSTDKLEAAAGELRAQGHEALAVPTDMRDPRAIKRLIERAVEKYGRIDLLINNAGQAASGTVAEAGMDDFRQIMELNVFGAMYAIQAVVPRMRETGGGVIINISSMVSKMQIPGLGTYAATKAALNKLSETARVELESSNIRVITLFPRLTATDFGKNSLGNPQSRQRQRTGAAAHMTADSPKFVGQKILEAARTEPAEQYMDS
jgi:short-subunit dehydrogenase